jgi:hypothetical protein
VPQVLDVISYDDSTGPQTGAPRRDSHDRDRRQQFCVTGWPSARHGLPNIITNCALCFDSTDERGRINAMKVLDSLEPTLDLSDGVQLIADLRKAFRELRALPPQSSSAVSGLDNCPLIMIAR